MAGLDEIRSRMAEFLTEQGLEAVTAWPEARRTRRNGAAAAVSLRSCESGPAGFQDYLGERYNQDTGRWEELYGRRVKITFGLDLYAAQSSGGAAAIDKALDTLSAALNGPGPDGLNILEFSIGETRFREDSELYHCPVEAVCQARLYAVADEGGTFLDFEIRGERL